jgi:hypothetical protein
VALELAVAVRHIRLEVVTLTPTRRTTSPRSDSRIDQFTAQIALKTLPLLPSSRVALQPLGGREVLGAVVVLQRRNVVRQTPNQFLLSRRWSPACRRPNVTVSAPHPPTHPPKSVSSDQKVANRNGRDFRVGYRSRGRYATPADSPQHECTPYRELHARCERLGFVPRSRAIFCRAVPKP